MTRIGLSGTNWTRKTTTIQYLVEALAPRPIEVVALSAFVEQCPFPMGAEQTLDGSRWMVERVEQILSQPLPSGKVQIFDRTPLDILAFTLYAAERAEEWTPNRESEPVYDLTDRIVLLGSQFTTIFLCLPDGDWPKPETPSSEASQFALLIGQYLLLAERHWAGPLVKLPWDKELRIAEIKTRLQQR